MSKTNTSSRLLAILRFTIPSKSSRTLNATQAYDKTSSGITLASATGRLVDKGAAVKDVPSEPGAEYRANIGLTFTEARKAAGEPEYIDSAERNTQDLVPAAAVNGVTMALTGTVPNFKSRDKFYNVSTAGFTGSVLQDVPGLTNSKATNPNTTFYGGISVATGDYRKWQGKYAVLKLNTTTGKGVLRIYEDE
jgi:hypothetical protein